MSEFAIQVKHLDKMYKLYNKPSDRLKEALGIKVPVREHYALRDVSFDVKRGETVGIIGTNGSGKSTILKIITGVLNPTGGEVEVDGRISPLNIETYGKEDVDIFVTGSTCINRNNMEESLRKLNELRTSVIGK